MDGFQSVLKCFLELQFGSAKFYTEPIKNYFDIFSAKYSQPNAFTKSAASVLCNCRKSVWFALNCRVWSLVLFLNLSLGASK